MPNAREKKHELPIDVQTALISLEQKLGDDDQEIAFLKFWCEETYQWCSHYLRILISSKI